jgi:GT2 family glycosyltransferase
MIIQIQMVLYKNNPDEVQKALEAINASLLPRWAKVLVSIGDNSGDSVYGKRIKKLISKFGNKINVKYLSSDVNLGHGQMHNKLFANRESEVEFILIVNPDGMISPHLILHMLNRMENVSVGATESRQLPIEHPKMFNLITGETSWCSGACMMIRANVFEELNGFDARFFLHGDDVDLSWRIRDLGFQLHYVPRAVFFHAKNMEFNGYPKQSESEKFYGPLGALLIAHKFGLKKGLKLMIDDLHRSSDPVHVSVLNEFNLISKTNPAIGISKDIPEYHHPWKFSANRY